MAREARDIALRASASSFMHGTGRMSQEHDDPTGPRNSGRAIATNAVYQVGGRLFASAARLLLAILLIRLAGVERYGEYALILSFLAVAEWIVDFGIVDIGVRDIARKPAGEQLLLRTVTILTSSQAVLAYACTVLALLALGYDGEVIAAGIIGGASLLVYTGVVVFRVLFRARMRISDDVSGEAAGALVLLAAVAVVSSDGQVAIQTLLGCYLTSRVAQAGVVGYLGRADFRLSTTRVSRAQVKRMIVQAAPLGVGGLLFSLNDNMVAIVLSKYTGLDAVALYQYSLRFVLPIVMIVQSLNVAFFPVLSRCWQSDRARFRATQQVALETSVIVGAGLFCLVNAGAEFLLGIAGPELVQSETVFRLLSCIVLLQVLTLPITPMIVVAGGVYKVLWLTAALVLVQLASLLWLVPLYGTIGAVASYLGVKLVIGTVPVIAVGQRLTGVRLSWSMPARTIAAAAIALAVPELTFGSGSLWAAACSGFVYFLMLLATGVLSRNRARLVRASIARSSPEAG